MYEHSVQYDKKNDCYYYSFQRFQNVILVNYRRNIQDTTISIGQVLNLKNRYFKYLAIYDIVFNPAPYW